jgi:hypothetical protein
MNDFIDLILLIARKMLSVYKHKEAYHTEERRLAEKFKTDPAAPRVHSQELFEEFDVFLVQIKEHARSHGQADAADARTEVDDVHVRRRGPGCSHVSATECREALRRRVKMMEDFVFTKRNLEWLEAVIATRDRANHNLDGGLKIETFAIFRNPHSTVHFPMWTAEHQPLSSKRGSWKVMPKAEGDALIAKLGATRL